jgi:hypothetical protein
MKKVYRILFYAALFAAAVTLILTADTTPMSFTDNLAFVVLGAGLAGIDCEAIYLLEIYLDDSTEEQEPQQPTPATPF